MLSLLGCEKTSYSFKQISELDNARSQLKRIKATNIQHPEVTFLLADSISEVAQRLKHDSLLAAALKAKAEAHIYLGNYQVADSLYNATLKTRFDGEDLLRAETYINLAEQNNFSGKYSDALTQANLAQELIEKAYADNLDMQLNDYKIALIKGHSYFCLNKNDSMQISMDKALKLAEELNNPNNIFFVYSYLGYFYYQLSDFSTAEKYMLKAYPIAEEEENFDALSALLVSLSGTAIGQKKYDEAVEHCRKALKIDLEQMKSESKLTYIYNNQAEAFYHKGDYSKALQSAHKSLQYGEKQKDTTQIMVTCGILSETYTAQRNYTEALRFSKRALDNMNNPNADWSKKEVLYKNMANLYKLSGNYAQALEFANLHSSAKDSLQARERFNAIHELKTKYETEKKDIDLETASLNLKIQKRTTKSLIALCITLFGVFSFIYYIQRKKLQAQRAIVLQNQKLSELTAKTLAPNCGNDYSENGNGNGLSEEKTNDLLRQLRTCMEDEKMYKNPTLTIDMLADAIQSNRSYLSIVINTRMKKGFVEYVNYYRVQEAKRLLQHTDDKVAHIYAEAGFGSAQSFYAIFKNSEKLTPAEYRKVAKSTH